MRLVDCLALRPSLTTRELTAMVQKRIEKWVSYQKDCESWIRWAVRGKGQAVKCVGPYQSCFAPSAFSVSSYLMQGVGVYDTILFSEHSAIFHQLKFFLSLRTKLVIDRSLFLSCATALAMPQRKSHTKSRFGCLPCKKRHIKVYFSNS